MKAQQRYRHALVSVVMAGAVALGVPGLVCAQTTQMPPSMYAASSKNTVYVGQLRMASELGRRALSELQAAPTDDGTPLDAVMLQRALDTYILIRAARHGMELAREGQKYPDPMLELAFKRVDQAWNLSRTPSDKLSWGMSRQHYLEISIHDFSRALTLVDQVLMLLP